MFTGLVQAIGTVESVDPIGDAARLRVAVEGWDQRPKPGDSVCVSGCCLTVAEKPSSSDPRLVLAFDAIPETLRRTTLGRLRPGSAVNLEASCTPETLLGGHVVQGHVEGVGEALAITTGDEHAVTIRPPADLMPCITPKGSVTIDGVSLTIAGADVEAGTFTVALIPTTLSHTTLGRQAAGDRCNIETDILARTVVHWAQHYNTELRDARAGD